jgi:murein DD-endopeptidase MepM/ murein hydrolase activator NlpD
MRVAAMLVLGASFSCAGLLHTPADGAQYGGTVSEFDVVPFSGGAVHVRLASDGYTIAEWATNSYMIPVAIDVERKTTNLRDVGAPIKETVLASGVPQRVAVWEMADRYARWAEESYFHVVYGAPTAKASPYVYALPFRSGETHRLIQGFNGTFSHTGDDAFAVDFEMPEGTAIRAARDGTVVAFNDHETRHALAPEFKDRSHANWIVVLHGDGTLGEYWHLAPLGVLVRVGQHVARGDVIGRSGFTGFSAVPHLHFEVHTALNGLHSESSSFVFKTSPDDEHGEPPVEGKSYTAFE